MRYAFIKVSGGIIDRVSFYNDPSLAVAALADHVKSMNPDRDDAAVYGPDGLVVNAKVFLNEEETGPIYIIAKPWHSLGFLVLSPDEPLGYVNPSKALSDLEKMRKEDGDLIKLYKVREIIWPIIQKVELERYNKGHGVENFDYPLFRNISVERRVMIKTVEIYFNDLILEAQAHLLKEFKTTEEDENWDVFPIAMTEREIEDS